MLYIANWKAMKEALSSVQGVGVHLFTYERQIQSAEHKEHPAAPCNFSYTQKQLSAGTISSRVLFSAFALMYLAKGGHFRCTLYNNRAYFECSSTSEQVFEVARQVLLLVIPLNDHFKRLERFLAQVQSQLRGQKCTSPEIPVLWGEFQQALEVLY